MLWGNRNWAPYLADVVTAAHADGQVRLLGVATSAYSSYSSCRQYREDFGLALPATGLVGSVRIDKVRPYFDRPGFRAPFVEGTVDAVRRAIAAGLRLGRPGDRLHHPFHPGDDGRHLRFGRTGRPSARAAPTSTQHLAVARAVIEQVGPPSSAASPSWQLAYQSRSGPPSMPWLDPDINDVIDDLAAAGRRGVVVVPIGFVSDHVEVVWDLDNEAAGDRARSTGCSSPGSRTPGVEPRFVADTGRPGRGAAGRRGRSPPESPVLRRVATRRPDFCAAGCCVNCPA